MPSRTPYSFTPSSSSSASSSASSSFIPYSNLSLHSRELFNTFSNNSTGPTVVSGLGDLNSLSGLGQSGISGNSLGGSSSRDEYDQLSFTPIYPSYSSSFSNSSLELHESLLLAIRERQQQQLLQMQQQLQQAQNSSTTASSVAAPLDNGVNPTQAQQLSDIFDVFEEPSMHHDQPVIQSERPPETAIRSLSASPLIRGSEASDHGDAPEESVAEALAISQGDQNTPNGLFTSHEVSASTFSQSATSPTSAHGVRRPTPLHLLVSEQAQDQDPGQMQERELDVTEVLDGSLGRSPGPSPLLLAQPLSIEDNLTLQTDPPEVRSTPLRPPRPPLPLLLEQQADVGNPYAYHPETQEVPLDFTGIENTQNHAHDSSSSDPNVNILADVSYHQELEMGFNTASGDSNLDRQSQSTSLIQTPSGTLYSIADGSLSMPTLVAVTRGALPRRRYTTRDYSSGSVSSDDWLNHPEVVAFNSTGTPAPEAAFPSSDHLQDVDTLDTSLDNQENIPPQSSHILAAAIENTPENNNGSFGLVFGPRTVSLPVIETPHGSTESLTDARIPGQHQEDLARHQNQQQQRQRLRHDAEEMRLMMESLTVESLTPVAAETVAPTSLLVDNSLESSRPMSSIQREETTLDIQSESAQPGDDALSDRLGLLGPLLSSTQAGQLSTSEGSLDFSLLGSTRHGFDSSILSMASRIRQARLTRLLRLMGGQESSVGYSERLQWGRIPPPDTRSMVNHASGSRGTSRAGSLEDGLPDLGPDTDLNDNSATEDGRVHTRNRDHIQPTQFYPVHYPTFSEVLDCNGNPIDCSSSESYASSSTSSVASYETIEEHDEDLEWMDSSERRRRQRARSARIRRNRGIIRGHGRSRVVSTGTVFEGVEHVSEADSLLAENYRYHSLKASWVTNPNGESWSDDDGDDPQRRRRHRGMDTDDKDPETIMMRRGPSSLGVLQPSLYHHHYSHGTAYGGGSSSGLGLGSGSGSGGLYYIYGNVRNRYGPENARRRRVLSEMTDLLRREQEWERELEQHSREMTALTAIRSEEVSLQPTDHLGRNEAPTSALALPVTLAARATVTTTLLNGSETQNTNPPSSTPAPQTSGPVASMWLVPDGDVPHGALYRPFEGFQDYEQGHSHYHPQGEPFNPQRVVEQYQLRPEQRPSRTVSTSSRQPQAIASMNRAPPRLSDQPQTNEPIAHQIRRAHNSHIVNLHRQWEMEQHQRLASGSQSNLLSSMSREQEQPQEQPQEQQQQRYSSAVFVPPPSQQQSQNYAHQSLESGSLSLARSSSGPVPLSRDNRSSFRSRYDSDGFYQFNLTGNISSHPVPGITVELGSSSSTSTEFISAPGLSLPSAPPESQAPFVGSSSNATLAAATTTVTTVTTATTATTTTMTTTGTRVTSGMNTVVPSVASSDHVGVMGSSALSTTDSLSSMAASSITNYPSSRSTLSSSSSSSPVTSEAVLNSLSANANDRRYQSQYQSQHSYPHLHQSGQQQHQQPPPQQQGTRLQQQQQYQHHYPRPSQWRARSRGNNSLYVNFESGTLIPEEKWRRGEEEMIGR
ncbi:hypothetical protein BGX28_009215 [Mortierella sp. GBA30]|nr:hypothetical protein BGX28_009215 [Mortierella sp. GBA30]